MPALASEHSSDRSRRSDPDGALTFQRYGSTRHEVRDRCPDLAGTARPCAAGRPGRNCDAETYAASGRQRDDEADGGAFTRRTGHVEMTVEHAGAVGHVAQAVVLFGGARR